MEVSFEFERGGEKNTTNQVRHPRELCREGRGRELCGKVPSLLVVEKAVSVMEVCKSVLQRSERLLEGGVGFELVSENQVGKRKIGLWR